MFSGYSFFIYSRQSPKSLLQPAVAATRLQISALSPWLLLRRATARLFLSILKAHFYLCAAGGHCGVTVEACASQHALRLEKGNMAPHGAKSLKMLTLKNYPATLNEGPCDYIMACIHFFWTSFHYGALFFLLHKFIGWLR